MPERWSSQDHAHHLGRQQMSLLIERSKGYLRASRATLRGPGWTALRAPGLRGSPASLSLPFSLPEPAGREMLTCLLRTRKNTLCQSQSSEGGWPSCRLNIWSLLFHTEPQSPEKQSPELFTHTLGRITLRPWILMSFPPKIDSDKLLSIASRTGLRCISRPFLGTERYGAEID